MDNPILDTDSYKSSHWLQYPPGTTKLVAYVESRGGVYDKTVFFGLQYLLKKYLSRKITEQHVREAEAFFNHHKLPFNPDDWLYIVHKLNGKIPLKIDAVPEGSVIPTKNILMRIESTDERCFWITTWFETLLLRIWYPVTVATLSWHCRKTIYTFLQKTADIPDSEISFKLHDFGARGVSSQESASIGGAAHLINFSGSDTIYGMLCANTYYDAMLTPSSIPAAEHSTIITWGEKNEEKAFQHIFQELSTRSPLVALPTDSYNTDNAVTNLWGNTLKESVAKSSSTLVIRTDSGIPSDIVLKTLSSLEKAFGAAENTKGYKVLNNVRILHSDQINPNMIQEILTKMTAANYSTSNIVFGMGGALLQQVNRDTLGFAYKVCEATIDGKAQPVQKVTHDSPIKQSKGGYLDLIIEDGEYRTVVEKHANSKLVPVFAYGELLKEYTLDDIRKKAWNQ